MADIKNKNILITGGAGYIGSVLSNLLFENGYNIRIIDNLSIGNKSFRKNLTNSQFEFIEGDICNEVDVTKSLDTIDMVIHLAAIVGDPPCQKYPELATKVNKEGSELLYQKAIEHKVKRFIFASTCSNYGKMSDPDGYVNELTPLNPVSLYAELKVEFEKYMLENKDAITKPVILRFSTAYGLSPRMRFDLTVNEFTKELQQNKQLDIYGEQFWRPYCHTLDLSRAILKTIEADENKVAFKAFNVGDNNENYQKKTLIKMILKQLPDKEKLVSYIEKDEDPRDYRVNFDKINSTMDFRLMKTVPDGIREIIKALSLGQFENPDDECYRNI